MKYFPLYINNAFVDALDGRRFTTRNAATGEPVSEFAAATARDVDQACRAARAAFPAWSALDAHVRAGYLLKIADGIKRRFREMAECEAMEAGKVIGATTTLDIPYSIEAFEYFAGICREIKGEVLPINGGRGNKTFDFVTYEPYGVAAIIAPYNFPLHLMTRSMAPALAAGNTVVCKASSMTASTLGFLSEICAEAGIPAGVVNVVHGSGSLIGEALCMDCFQTEVFGPVLTVTKYRTLEEAIALANNTSFGLGANLFTSDLRKAYWTAKRLAAGTVWINTENGSQMHTPFGGNKNSGLGREYGSYGLHEYLRAKNNVWNMRLATDLPYGGEDDYTKTVWRD